MKNNLPISLLLKTGKLFELIFYNSLLNFLNQNDLIFPVQSGFKPVDSCNNQLLSIIYNKNYSVDEGYEIWGVFPDISKVFDKIWYENLIFKLKQNGISGSLISI